jgi:ribonucleoside-diphosphate reductase alpha chain
MQYACRSRVVTQVQTRSNAERRSRGLPNRRSLSEWAAGRNLHPNGKGGLDDRWVVSVSLQHGVSLKVLCDKLSHTRFEPSGWTGNEELGYAKSIMDYLFRWMELRFLSGKQLPLFAQQTAVVVRQGSAESNQAPASISQSLHDSYEVGDAPLCVACGSLMVRNGSCHKCPNCGGTSSCS